MHTMREIQKTVILSRLAHFNYRVVPAAKSLGITYRTLYNKLHKYGMTPDLIKEARLEYIKIESKFSKKTQ